MNRPDETAPQADWNRYVFERVAPIVAESDERFRQLWEHARHGVPGAVVEELFERHGLMPDPVALQARLEVVTAQAVPLVDWQIQLLLSHAAAAINFPATGVTTYHERLREAFAPDPIPYPIWMPQGRRLAESGSAPYFAPDASVGRAEAEYHREYERRRLLHSGLDPDARRQPGEDEALIMHLAGLGSLGGRNVVVLPKPKEVLDRRIRAGVFDGEDGES